MCNLYGEHVWNNVKKSKKVMWFLICNKSLCNKQNRRKLFFFLQKIKERRETCQMIPKIIMIFTYKRGVR